MSTAVGIIGCGNLGRALAEGVARESTQFSLFLFDTSEEKRTAVAESSGGEACANLEALVTRSEVVVLAIKPKDVAVLTGALSAIDGFKGQLYISVVAGVTAEAFSVAFGRQVRLVRTMPNLASTIGLGITGVWGEHKEDVQLTEKLFAPLGKTVAVAEEALLDAVVGASASSPAFVFLFIAGLIDAAKSKGLSDVQARELAIQAVEGAAALAGSSAVELDELIERVASPNGTTEAGLKVLEVRKFREVVKEAAVASIERSAEIGVETLSQMKKN